MLCQLDKVYGVYSVAEALPGLPFLPGKHLGGGCYVSVIIQLACRGVENIHNQKNISQDTLRNVFRKKRD